MPRKFTTWIEALAKPEYVLQPKKLVRRLLGRTAARGPDGVYRLGLPWGLELRTTRLDNVTQAIDVLGVYDIVVTEAIWRLTSPGDTVVDVGANVGYMTVAMAARLRERGRVFSFEPQPGVLEELDANISAAKARFPGVSVFARFEALSDSNGTASLSVTPPDGNRGEAHLLADGAGVSVPMRQLDSYAGELGSDVPFLKIDVERHEPAVLRGASGLLGRGVFRNVVFEEHEQYPTEATSILEHFGYTIFALERRFVGVRLGDPAHFTRSSWEASSLLATRAPEAALRAFRVPGWRCLA